ncbi:MAG: imidazole glycerol phosphate synthase subunit HisH [Dokdonella sp.]
MNVVLVDAGGTNIGSVRYALQRLGVDAPLSSDADRIRRADKVILPGVGAAAPGMARLREAGLINVLRELTQPVLGVCLGMQLLFDHSDEGNTTCLGVIPGRVTAMQGEPGLRVPHMGWNRLEVCVDDPLLADLPDDAHAYFVHSYAAAVSPATIGSSTHGAAFSAIVRHRNFCGMQFHPERSAAVGATLLKNFISL